MSDRMSLNGPARGVLSRMDAALFALRYTHSKCEEYVNVL